MENLLSAYTKMAKGFRTLKFQKKIEAMDLLNSTMENICKRQLNFDSEIEGYWYLKKAMIDKTKNSYRDIKRFDLLKKANCESIESREYGVTEIFINELVEAILQDLKGIDKSIFKQYFIEGFTCLEIAKSLEVVESTISRKVKEISKVIHNQKVNYFYDERYVRYSPKKKREKIDYPDYQENDGEIINLDLGDYEETKKIPYNYNLDLTGNYVFLQKEYYSNPVTVDMK